MEDIIHYRYVKEDLTKEVEIINEIEEPIRVINVHDDVFSAVQQTETVERKHYKSVPVTEEELKAAMSANEGVTITRSVLVVSENIAKNTITIKRYSFKKVFVTVKNIKRKKFKVLNQEMSGLSINKTTGDYYVFSSRRMKRGVNKTFIRHNIITKQIKKLLNFTVRSIEDQTTEEAQSIFYKLLGYKPILDYKGFIEYYLNPQVIIDPIPKNSIIVFPFLNYLSCQGIKLPEYHELHLFETIFKRDKKQFLKNGSSLHDVVKVHYGVKDDRIVRLALAQMYHKANDHYISEAQLALKNKSKHSYAYTEGMFTHLCLDGLTLKLSAKKPLTDHELGQLALTGYGYDTFDKLVEFQSKMLDLYNFNIVDINEHSKVTAEFNNKLSLLYYFTLFGVKLKYTSFRDIDKNYETVYKIFDSLCYARSKTGTVMIDEKFMAKIKSRLEPDLKIGIHHQMTVKKNKFDQDIDFFGVPILRGGKESYKRQFTEDDILPWLYISMPENKQLNFRLSFQEGHTQMRGANNHNSVSVYMLMKELSDNRKNILKDLEIKQIYSRKYFENHLKNVFGINAQDCIEYLN